ncbi:methyl-accepting chemotaxis protein [Clostridium sp. ZS2-4]|uniref:methyl-accepting chemotaxis protein n=1 Tax=Clostridium sp. ZS2-4 TaxID=2987703 RepID=UPI00227AB0CE|nr:methyl-accepting chemotaxis protein [Clostridium sp. ZS2-4]MCY6354259.1 methyl-accepting chemotaxis protein [Clostridium sp. ZS2-4]
MNTNIDTIMEYQRKTYKLIINIYILSIIGAIVAFMGLKTLGLYPEIKWKYIVGFIILGLSEIILFMSTKDNVLDRTRANDKTFSKFKALVGLGCFVNYVYIAIMIPSKEIWVCVFYFVLLSALFLDKKLTIQAIALSVICEIVVFKINSSVMPSQDVLLREGFMRLIVIVLISFGIYFFMNLSANLLEKVDDKMKIEIENNAKTSKLFNKISEFAQTLLSSSETLTSIIEEEYGSIQEIASTSTEVNKDSNEILLKTKKNKDRLDTLLKLNKTVSIKAMDTETSSSDLINIANENKSSINKSLNIIDNIKGSIENTLNVAKILNEKSDQLDSIFKILSDISEKTNLLALNASIEAARVGDSGKGFAVVANEIKKLSENTKQSLDQVGCITDEFKDKISKVEKLMIDNNGKVLESNNMLNMVSDNVEEMMTVLNTSVGNIKDINTSTEMLLTEVNSVVDFNSNIYETTRETINKFKTVSEEIKQNVNLIEEISINTENLKDVAIEMNSLIE